MSKARGPLLALAVIAVLFATTGLLDKSPTKARLAPVSFAERVGMGMSHDLVNRGTAVIEREFRRIRAGGVSWIREDIAWALAEPHPGVFNWAPFDRLMQAASRAGVHVLGILDYSAPWASSDLSGRGGIFYPPKDDREFASYSASVAARYGSNGTFWSAHPKLIRTPLAAVEIWNEPYGSWFWKPGPSPSAYAALVRATAPAVHAADPRMLVLMSGDLQSWDVRTSGHYEPWLTRLLQTDPGLTKLVDAFDIHPYPEPREAGPYAHGFSDQLSYGRVPLIHQAELDAGVDLPLWITEIGWSTAPHTKHAITDRQQASFMRGAVRRAVGEWGAYVQKVFLFSWYPSDGLVGSTRNYGLLDRKGSPKSAWYSITQLLKPGAGTL